MAIRPEKATPGTPPFSGETANTASLFAALVAIARGLAGVQDVGHAPFHYQLPEHVPEGRVRLLNAVPRGMPERSPEVALPPPEFLVGADAAQLVHENAEGVVAGVEADEISDRGFCRLVNGGELDHRSDSGVLKEDLANDFGRENLQGTKITRTGCLVASARWLLVDGTSYFVLNVMRCRLVNARNSFVIDRRSCRLVDRRGCRLIDSGSCLIIVRRSFFLLVTRKRCLLVVALLIVGIMRKHRVTITTCHLLSGTRWVPSGGFALS